MGNTRTSQLPRGSLTVPCTEFFLLNRALESNRTAAFLELDKDGLYAQVLGGPLIFEPLQCLEVE